MLNSTQLKVLTIISALALAATARAQVLLGGFQGASDPTDAGWTDTQDSDPITSDPNASFVAASVPGYPLSLQMSGSGGFGNPSSLELSLSAGQIQALLTNSWLTFTFSVPPSSATGGYSQIYNLQFQFYGAGFSSSYGSTNWGNGGNAAATWGVYSQAEGSTNSNTSGEPNFGLYSGYPLQTETVTINYSGLTNAIIAGLSSANYVNILFQGNTGGGAPTMQDFNNVELSTGPFGTSSAATTSIFIVDNFSSNGVGPQNPTNDDYYTSSNNYAAGQITNVWWNWFGSAFSNTVWASGISPSYAPSQGSMALNVNWPGTSGQQFELWDQGPTNDFYAVNISALSYTNFQCDVMFAPGSATNQSGNFGLLQFGNRTSGYGQDYFGGGNNGITVAATNAGVWQHVSIGLNPINDTNLLSIQGILFHMYDGSGQLTGASTIYLDNIEFVGPLVTPPPPPPPVVSIEAAKPGLRMFVGSSATYLREGVITTQGSGENESWAGSGAQYPVTYSFQLLSYPSANIGVTELAILPEASFNTTAFYQTTIYNNPYLDYQDSNGLYLAIAPYTGGAVTATVQWKVGLAGANPTNTVLTITNSTAIGTWTLTMSSATAGTLTAPGSSPEAFTIADPNVSSDFANPAVAVLFEEPNSTAGYGLYEDFGTISITGTGSGNQTENFANESSDFNSGTSPGGFFQNNYSVDPGNLVIARNGLDAYWVNWTQDILNNYALVTATNLLVPPSQWISPIYYSDYNIPDETAPRGVDVQHAPDYWELLPADDLPTVDGNFQQNPPAVNDPLAPNAYFMLTTNTANIYPVTP